VRRCDASCYHTFARSGRGCGGGEGETTACCWCNSATLSIHLCHRCLPTVLSSTHLKLDDSGKGIESSRAHEPGPERNSIHTLGPRCSWCRTSKELDHDMLEKIDNRRRRHANRPLHPPVTLTCIIEHVWRAGAWQVTIAIQAARCGGTRIITRPAVFLQPGMCTRPRQRDPSDQHSRFP
jgi:hypothetical protein